MMTFLDLQTRDVELIYKEMIKKLTRDIHSWLEGADPEVPTILAAHASVEGAVFGAERSVSLGKDLVLPVSLVKDPRLDYTALGHIHKKQDLNEGAHPPVIYPGSIERVNFGEARDDKFYVIADLKRGKTTLDWRQLKNIRPFVDVYLKLESNDNILDQVKKALPSPAMLKDALVRLILEYPRAWDPLINESAIRDLVKDSFEFHFVKQPLSEVRIRLPKDRAIGTLPPQELLDQYWEVSKTPEDEIKSLNELAQEIINPEGELE